MGSSGIHLWSPRPRNLGEIGNSPPGIPEILGSSGIHLLESAGKPGSNHPTEFLLPGEALGRFFLTQTWISLMSFQHSHFSRPSGRDHLRALHLQEHREENSRFSGHSGCGSQIPLLQPGTFCGHWKNPRIPGIGAQGWWDEGVEFGMGQWNQKIRELRNF